MNIVVVEDSVPVRRLLVRRLLEAQLDVIGTAVRAEDAVQLVIGILPDAVLLDLKLSSGSGLWLLAKLRARGFAGKIYVFSLDDRGAYADLCRRRGGDGFFDKANDLEALMTTLGQAAADL